MPILAGGTRLARVGPQISIWNAVCCLTHVSSQSSLSVMRALHKGSKNALPLPRYPVATGKKNLEDASRGDLVTGSSRVQA